MSDLSIPAKLQQIEAIKNSVKFSHRKLPDKTLKEIDMGSILITEKIRTASRNSVQLWEQALEAWEYYARACVVLEVTKSICINESDIAVHAQDDDIVERHRHLVPKVRAAALHTRQAAQDQNSKQAELALELCKAYVHELMINELPHPSVIQKIKQMERQLDSQGH